MILFSYCPTVHIRYRGIQSEFLSRFKVISDASRDRSTMEGIIEVPREMMTHTGIIRVRREELHAPSELKLAVENGDLAELKRLHEQEGAELSREVLVLAAEHGHLDCLRYIRESGCRWNALVLANSAYNGHLECLRYALENGCDPLLPTMITTSAANSGQLDCLKYLREEKQFEWDYQTTAAAAGKGSLECLKYAHENGCNWDETTCQLAASSGHLECLKYAHEHGCPFGNHSDRRAAQQGMLKCLQYIYESGGHKSKDVVKLAATNGRFKCLKYALEVGCEYDVKDDVLSVFNKNLNEDGFSLNFDKHSYLRKLLFPHIDTELMNDNMNTKLNKVCKAKRDEIELQRQYAYAECSFQLSSQVTQFILIPFF
jgi:hypothetical protein